MSEYVARYDAYVTTCHLPARVKGVCHRIVDEDVILLNEDLCHADQIKAAEHEGKHLRMGDLDKEDAVKVIEK